MLHSSSRSSIFLERERVRERKREREEERKREGEKEEEVKGGNIVSKYTVHYM